MVFAWGSWSSADEPHSPGTLLWVFDPGLPQRPGDEFTEPAIGPDGTIYVSHVPANNAGSGQFFAINPDGSERWSKTFAFHAYWESLTRGFSPTSVAPDGRVYFSAGRTLYCYSPDGTEVWKRSFPSSNPWNYSPYLHATAISESGRLYLPHDDQGLYELDPATGAPLWSFLPVEPHVYVFARAVSVGADGSVYFPAWDSDFFKLTANGDLLFKYVSGGRPNGDHPASLDVMGRCYLTQGGLRQSQEVRIYEPGGGRATALPYLQVTVDPLIGSDGELYFANRSGRLRCVNADLSLRWSAPGFADQAPILAEDGTVYAVTGDPESPSIVAMTRAGVVSYRIEGQMEDPGATAFVYEYEHSAATPIARLALGYDGTLYAASNNGRVYAFAGESPLSRSDWPKLFGGYGNAGRVTHLAPELTRQPDGDGGVVVSGEPRYLEAAFIGRPVPEIQWFRNGEPVPGATSHQLGLGLGGVSDQGEYFAVIENSAGSAQSETVRIEVQHRLRVDLGTGGSVTVEPPGPLYQDGASVTVTPVPEAGYAFKEWGGDAAGSAAPLVVTMGESKVVSASFEDVEAPALHLVGAFPMVVETPRLTIEGTAGDNAVIGSLTVTLNGGAPMVLDPSQPGFAADLNLRFGENHISVSARDSSGRETTETVMVEWAPARYWLVAAPESVGEAAVFESDIILGSPGDVAGAHLTIAADPVYLSLVEFTPSPELEGFATTTSEADGVINLTFASLSGPVGEGERTVGTARYRVRSLPAPRDEVIAVNQLNLAGEDGTPLLEESGLRNASVELTPRLIIGDVNNNGRFDTGDSQQMQRLLGGLDETRPWDGPLNDVNGSGGLEIGDVIVVLRTAAGIIEQPSAGDQARPAEARVSAPFIVGAPTTWLTMDRHWAQPGDRVKVQVRVSEVPHGFGGASFTLDYPVEALLLEDESSHRPGPLLPGSALRVWNVAPGQNDFANQTGTVVFASGSAENWGGSEGGGVVADISFTVQSGAVSRPVWPLELRDLEVSTGDGLKVVKSNLVAAVFVGQPVTWEEWLSAKFGEDVIGDVQVTGRSADPDSDGSTNIGEYFAGSDPLVADGGSVVRPVYLELPADERRFGIQFDYDVRAVGVIGVPELSENLRTWWTAGAGGPASSFVEIDVADLIEAGDHTGRRTFIVAEPERGWVDHFFRVSIREVAGDGGPGI